MPRKLKSMHNILRFATRIDNNAFCCGDLNFIRIVKSMTEVLGDFNFAELASDPSAFHAKCLMCDKPVSARARSARKDVLMSRTTPLNGFDDSDVDFRAKFPGVVVNTQSQPRLGSPAPLSGKQLRNTRINSDINIARSSVDFLPQITVCF
jgi:hypothetical protein